MDFRDAGSLKLTSCDVVVVGIRSQEEAGALGVLVDNLKRSDPAVWARVSVGDTDIELKSVCPSRRYPYRTRRGSVIMITVLPAWQYMVQFDDSQLAAVVSIPVEPIGGVPRIGSPVRMTLISDDVPHYRLSRRRSVCVLAGPLQSEVRRATLLPPLRPDVLYDDLPRSHDGV